MKLAQTAKVRRPNAGAFKPGNHPVHDMAAAGRKGKATSPWNKGSMLNTKNACRFNQSPTLRRST